MIASGELFLLNGDTGVLLQPLPDFLNKNIRVLATSTDRIYVACEPPVPPQEAPRQACTVWCLRGDSRQPELCQDFDAIEGSLREIAIGEEHLLVLTHEGTVWSKGTSVYGNTGHGGAKSTEEFRPLPALRNRKVKAIACGPHYSIAITDEGDVFSWGRGFNGETGVFGQVETVPRYAPAVTKFQVIRVSCGNAHVLAVTEGQQCISWGENTCGQLGIGCKSKPTYKPQVLDTIPSQIKDVSAGWAHSVAVGTDGRAYTWGLNSHGQLGLGDVATRLAPHLLHDLLDSHQVESARAARTLTAFLTIGKKALLCGQIPFGPKAKHNVEFHPRRPGNTDPAGCVLAPVPLTIASAGPYDSRSQLSQVLAYDRGVVAFARSTVYKVEPNLAPLHGGTQVRTYVNGLPFDRFGRRSIDGTALSEHDSIPVRVRLKSSSPLCDFIVAGKIVDLDTVEFTTPNVVHSPLGSVVGQGVTSAVQIRVSIDDGFTWTPDRYSASNISEMTGGTRQRKEASMKQHESALLQGLQNLKNESVEARRAMDLVKASTALLYYCRWPQDGPTHVEPTCVPVSGDSELLLHVDLPPSMPAEQLIVKFMCTPLHSIGDPEAEDKAPMRRAAAAIVNPDKDEVAKLPLATPLEVPVVAWLDPAGQGVRVVSPPLDAESVRFYDYSVALSLDGHTFLSRTLPLSVYDLKVTALEPNTGSLLEPTQVKVMCEGLVPSDIHWVRLDFPPELGWKSRQLPASLDHTTGEISFAMPEMVAEVRERVDMARAGAAAASVEQEGGSGLPAEGATAAPGVASDAGSAAGAPAVASDLAVDPNGGLRGLEVFVELSLNGQNFTQDSVPFTYHSPLVPEAVSLLSMPEGYVATEPPPDPKAKGKKAAEEAKPTDTILPPGAKLGCKAEGLQFSSFAVLRADLMVKVPPEEPVEQGKKGAKAPEPQEEEEPVLFRVVDMPGTVEMITPQAPPPPPPDPKEKNPPPPPEPEPLPPVQMLTALTPAIRSEELPVPGSTLFLTNFQVSLNSLSFVACPVVEGAPRMRLEPLPPEPPQDQ